MGRSISQPAEVSLRLTGQWDVYPPGGRLRGLRHLAKEALFFFYLRCGFVQIRDALLSLAGRSRVVIVYYHRIGWVDRLSKTISAFRQDLRYLKKHYECITLTELVERLNSGAPIRRKIAVITFDDGYLDNYQSAYDQLKRAGLSATFFVSTGFIGTSRKFEHDVRAREGGYSVRDDWSKMTWEQLREMQDGGMEIGSHTVDHVKMANPDLDELRRQAVQSLEQLEAHLGRRPRTFSFPWGKPSDFSDAAIAAVREAGYLAAVTTSAGIVHVGDDLFRLRRNDTGNGNFSRLATRAVIEGFGRGWLARVLRR